MILLPHGEKVKSRQMKAWVEDRLMEMGCVRDTCLVAVGGGEILDLVGFVAATYCRGVPYVTFPTTLLAMTDAAIGGKTGIDIPGTKNLVGAFYPPRQVTIDTTVLQSLPEEELVSGLAETIKHALIASAPLFVFLEENLDAILGRENGTLLELVKKSVVIKKAIVEGDPYEKDQRRWLNLGHTIGHAIESLTTLRHGEAVALGLYWEGRLAVEMGLCSREVFERIASLLRRVPFALDLEISIDDLLERIQLDKKRMGEVTYFVGLKKIGEVEVIPLPEEVLRRCFAPSSQMIT
ncbi:MAG: 3-dehydroquinate synthase [Chlamydiae bacterium]|nr:3-dehydroquinate synthase [Chlamydiota bacterium]